MELFSVLVLVAISMLIAAIFLYIKSKMAKGYKVKVDYSELLGDAIIQSENIYTGYINEQDDKFYIPRLKLERPVPVREAILPTFSGKSKVYLIKFGNERYGYRIPVRSNLIFSYVKDEEGNIIKDKYTNKPLIQKHKWRICDEVIEPDVKHWEENLRDEIWQKHKIRQSALERWIAPLSIVLIFLFAIITLNITTKNLVADKKAILEKAAGQEEQAKELSQSLNNLINKVSGSKVLYEDETSQREEYYNKTKT